MPNYGYSTPYKGMSGGPLPPGYLQAAMEPGKQMAQGIRDMGSGVGKMIQQYVDDGKKKKGLVATLGSYISDSDDKPDLIAAAKEMPLPILEGYIKGMLLRDEKDKEDRELDANLKRIKSVTDASNAALKVSEFNLEKAQVFQAQKKIYDEVASEFDPNETRIVETRTPTEEIVNEVYEEPIYKKELDREAYHAAIGVPPLQSALAPIKAMLSEAQNPRVGIRARDFMTDVKIGTRPAVRPKTIFGEDITTEQVPLNYGELRAKLHNDLINAGVTDQTVLKNIDSVLANSGLIAPIKAQNIGNTGLVGVSQGTGLAKIMQGTGGATVVKAAESKMRSEWTKLGTVIEFNKQATAFTRLKASAEKESAAGDMALVFNYMKILDPGSTVREGEYATAKNATGIPDRVLNLYNQAKDGKFLNPEQRQDFVETAGRLYSRAEKEYLLRRGIYEKIAVDQGLNPKFALPDFSRQEVREKNPSDESKGESASTNTVYTQKDLLER